eukprot:Hpha_TRINITY_DN30099_c0_g1::TRINITY_DN30099_c0_g1_i1::g.21506::m.21506
MAVLIAALLGTVGVSPGAELAGKSDVVWTDAQWKADGTAQMPIGNGDTTAGVWVDSTNGDLVVLASRSNVFDENTQPVHTGVLRFSFQPPLWTSGMKGFEQRLGLAGAKVTVKTPSVSVEIFADTTPSASPPSPAIRVGITPVVGNNVSVSAKVVPYRKAQKSALGREPCWPLSDTPDVVLPGGAQRPEGLSRSVVWYHKNPTNSTYYTRAMALEGVPTKGLEDPFSGVVFGGALQADTALALSSDGTTLSTAEAEGLGTPFSFIILQRSGRKETPDEFAAGLEAALTTLPSTESAAAASASAWDGIWGRSWVNFSCSGCGVLNDHIVYERYLELVQGMHSATPIKFNGQGFTANISGKGWDYRDWGAAYWWQNTRQPYYNSLVQGDFDVLSSCLAFYTRMLPYAQARTIAQNPNLSHPAALFPETTTQYATWDPCDYGCSTKPGAGVITNHYIRFHYEGGLEICLLHLDAYSATGVPLGGMVDVCVGVVEGYMQRFPNRDKAGKVDMFPSQCLETFQCPDPTSRSNCVTNPTPEVAGLHAVLTRMVALPSTLLGDSERKRCTDFLAALPVLKTSGGYIHPYTAEEGPTRTSNSENVELYAVHPFRQYGVSKPDLGVGKLSYTKRRFPCNDGWCQDVIDAAMLGLSDEAGKQVLDRAAKGKSPLYRFPGFGAHFQDYEPSLDHFAFMRTAVNYMLIAPKDDAKLGVVLFPALPKGWDVSFSLRAPRNTTITAECIGGKVTKLEVTPEGRRADIQIGDGCAMS